MAGIGDYIHYKIRDYGIFGLVEPSEEQKNQDDSSKTNINKENKISEINKAKKKLLSRANQTYEDAKIKKIEEFFNAFMYGDSIDTAKSDQKYNKALDMFFKDFINYANEHMSQVGKVFSDVDSVSNLAVKKNVEDKNISNVTQKKGGSTRHEVENLINFARNLLNSAISQPHVNIDKINEIKNTLETDFIDRLEKEFNDWKKLHPNEEDLLTFQGEDANVGKKLKSLLQSAYDLVRLDSIPGKTIMQGTILEVFLEYVINAGAFNIAKEIDITKDLVEDFLTNSINKKNAVAKVVGGQRSTTGINAKNLSKKLLEYEGSSVLLEGNSNPTQDKADVMMTVQDTSYGISAKNYKLKWNVDDEANIHIVSGTPFYNLFMNTDPIIANHWLNAHSKAVSSQGKNLSIQDNNLPKPDNNSEYSSFSSVRSAARNAIRVSILYQALTGDLFGRSNKAELLVINDLSSKRIYFLPVKSILSSIMKIESNENRDINDTNSVSGFTIKGLSKNSIAEEWHENDSVRIMNLLTKLRDKKISASISITKKTVNKIRKS